MNIVITGSSSGIGQELCSRLALDHRVIPLTRHDIDLSDLEAVRAFALPRCDMLINCAGTGLGGKTDFLNHASSHWIEIINVNLISAMLLAQKALIKNDACRIVNITSTNNRRYWPGDLSYSLSKRGLAEFGDMLRVEYPSCAVLEIRLGLTRTRFNQNRYRVCADRFEDIYHLPHLSVQSAVDHMMPALLDRCVKFIEIAP